MSVSSPSTGASVGVSYRITPMAELEVPKSSPQAVMQVPYYAREGTSLITISVVLPDCFFVSRVGQILGCPKFGRPFLFVYERSLQTASAPTSRRRAFVASVERATARPLRHQDVYARH